MVTEIAAATVALALSATSLASATYYYVHLARPRRTTDLSPTLILPLTGDKDIGPLVALLETQTLPPRRLIVAVESDRDPAHARTTAIARRAAFPIETVIAGTSSWRGQKCTNLIAAAAAVGAEDVIIVLLDADIRPQPWWLMALAAPIAHDEADVVTGYRWQVIDGPLSLPAHLAAVIDRSVALLPRLPWTRIVWGGSTALSRAAFTAIDLPSTLDRTLSDDLTLGRRIDHLGLRLMMRRALLLPTPTGGNLGGIVAFGIRQCRIIRLYRPDLWWPMAICLTAAVASNAALLALAPDSRLAQIALGLIAAMGFAIALLRDRVARTIEAEDVPGIFGVQALLSALPILVASFFLAMVVASALSRRIVWRHVEYDVAGPYEVAVHRRNELSP